MAGATASTTMTLAALAHRRRQPRGEVPLDSPASGRANAPLRGSVAPREVPDPARQFGKNGSERYSMVHADDPRGFWLQRALAPRS